MTEILFKCPGCHKSLCAGETAIGRSFNCPACQGMVILPEPDFIFNCPSCDGKLAVPASMSSENFQCPLCGKEFTTPASGAKYAPPLKARPEKITCPSCSSELEVDYSTLREWAGQEVNCPVCNGSIKLPPLPPAQSSSFFPMASPPPSLTPVTIQEKSAALPTEARSFTAEPRIFPAGLSDGEKKESRLKLKTPLSEIPSSNPAMERFKLPVFSIWQKLMPLLKKIAILLVIMGLIAGSLYFVDLGKSESKNWKVAVQSLGILKNEPLDATALDTIKKVIPDVGNGMTGRTPKTGLMAVWALGQLKLGNTEKGLTICRWIENNYSGTRFTASVAYVNFTQDCECRNQQTQCPKCNGNVTCPACDGKGKKIFSVNSPIRGAKTLGSTTKRKYRKMGEADAGHGHSLGDASPGKTLQQVCTSCNGTGRCALCKGTGKTITACSKCGGRGWIFSRAKLDDHYSSLVKRVYLYSVLKLALEKIVDIGIFVQKMTKSAQPGAESPSSDDFPADLPVETKPPVEPVDWAKRYDDLYREYSGKFVTPKLEEHISIRINGGKTFAGILAGLSESNLEIRSASSNVNVTVGFQNTQLDTESRIVCFRNDFAAFHAKKQCDEEKSRK
ncbi:MAG: hypothetical protein PHR77_07410 [Kiritimatiellae bacterium]|nr:hypothetical protein [Kiritimatiellia bacterium]MDD5522265.1 hypothetical protein [Kiritimatiellia bacterium]